MPIIKKEDNKKVLQKVKIDSLVLNEVQAYCKHFEVSPDDFANQAFKFVLESDKDWKAARTKAA